MARVVAPEAFAPMMLAHLGGVIVTEAELEIFRLKMRVAVLEQIVAELFLAARPLVSKAEILSQRQVLRSRLEGQTRQLTQTFGAATGDPALTALYAGVVEEIESTWKTILEKLP
jgi:hypothetical protein